MIEERGANPTADTPARFRGRRAPTALTAGGTESSEAVAVLAGPRVRIHFPPAASLLRMDRCAGEARQSLARQQIARATSAAGSVPRQ